MSFPSGAADASVRDGELDERRPPRLVAWLPAAMVAALLLLIWVRTDTPVLSVLWYLVCFALVVTLPGLLVRRLALGRAGDLVDELALDSVTGLVLLTPVWAFAATIGMPLLLVAWPFLLGAVLLVPRRTRTRIVTASPSEHVPSVASWLMALAATGVVIAWGSGFAASTQLPPGPLDWYSDDYWHLGLAAELGRGVPPTTPNVAGPTFMYHWFANANIWTMSEASGLDLVTVYARLWEPPLRLLAVGLAYVLGRRVTGSSITGALAAVLLAFGTELRLTWFSFPGHAALNLHSPSQLFGLLILLFVLILLFDLYAGRAGRGQLSLLVAAALSTVGAKSSIPPVILTGTGLAWLRTVTARWLGPVDTTVRRATGAFGLGLVTIVAGMVFAAGGAAGVSPQLFAGARITPAWAVLTGVKEHVIESLVMPGLERPHALIVLALLLAHFLMSFVWLAPAWSLLRRGVAFAWLLLGVGIGGFLAMLLLNQDGSSQVYFMMGALPALQVLALWGLRDATRRARALVSGQTVRRAVLAGALVGALVATLLAALSRYSFIGRQPSRGFLVETLGVSLLVGLALAATAAILLRARPGTTMGVILSTAVVVASVLPQIVTALRGRPSVTLLLVISAALAIMVVAGNRAPRDSIAVIGVLATALSVWSVLPRLDQASTTKPFKSAVSAEELDALRWVADHTPADDLVATNMHCTAKRTTPHCDARGFWVTGFSQRRALVEGWAYTAEAHAMQGVGGLRSTRQPFHDQALLALNERAFTAPTAATIDELHRRGVRWLIADLAAGPVSPELASLAHEAYSSGSMTIYQLR
ncbi:hypothetical protein I6I76_00920 [Dermacoccus nishinomiyaensis]|uniref:hypothetical protein n=1 Tax=Dermacoccus nishinomiyaensis TaxID=1274 RepID=UPI000E02BEC5|nr:hypothetical protein [Dermacoccus nishinomiyaensis]QQY24772.1 hypothetical protein I6I76_00920 [Dermacoccus nishinomiyaensis]STD19291.1 Uncharacterised protein [Dermacoccus nishinomiyaensis]